MDHTLDQAERHAANHQHHSVFVAFVVASLWSVLPDSTPQRRAEVYWLRAIYAVDILSILPLLQVAVQKR